MVLSNSLQLQHVHFTILLLYYMYIILILNEFVHMWCFLGPARQCRMYEKKYFPLIFTIFTNAFIVKQFSLKKAVGL